MSIFCLSNEMKISTKFHENKNIHTRDWGAGCAFATVNALLE
jgi:hypothetical protein